MIASVASASLEELLLTLHAVNNVNNTK